MDLNHDIYAGKTDWQWSLSSLTLLLGNCYDVTGGIFDRWISAKQVWKVLLNDITNQEQKNNEGILESIANDELVNWPEWEVIV